MEEEREEGREGGREGGRERERERGWDMRDTLMTVVLLQQSLS